MLSYKKTVVIAYAHLPEVRELKDHIEKTNYRDNIRLLRWNQGLDLPNLTTSTNLIMNVGFAGMLNPNFEMEEVHLINKIAYLNDQEVVFRSEIDQICLDFSRQFHLKTASLLTSKNPIINQLLRDKLYRLTCADLVDMEAYFLYERAKKERVKFMSLKIVSDLADEEATQSVKEKTVRLSDKLGQTVINFLEFYFNGSYSSNTGL